MTYRYVVICSDLGSTQSFVRAGAERRPASGLESRVETVSIPRNIELSRYIYLEKKEKKKNRIEKLQ